jgi:hypothetical protein
VASSPNPTTRREAAPQAGSVGNHALSRLATRRVLVPAGVNETRSRTVLLLAHFHRALGGLRRTRGVRDGPQYTLNPGEGWAEAYRRMNELRAGNWPDIGWNVVDPFFSPDATALTLVARDVTDPWSGPSVHTATGRLRRHGVRGWTFHPYDGPMSASVTGPRGTTGSFVSGGKVVRAPARRVSGTVCGDPSVTVVVRSALGGRFNLRLSEDAG